MKEGDRIPELVGWEYHGFPVKEGGDLMVVATGETEQTNDRPYAATVYAAARGNVVFNAETCPWSMLLARPPGPGTRRTRTSAGPTPASSGSRRTCSTGSSRRRAPVGSPISVGGGGCDTLRPPR